MEYDLFVIGGGSGGVRAARWAASRGANVALCESDRMGGTCVIRGCVPKKLMSYAGKYKKTSKLMESFGLQTENIQFDWNTLKQNRDREIERLEGIYGRLLSNTGVDVIKGHGQIVSKNEVKVGESTYKAKSILIATGGKPYNPLSIPGSEHIISSDQIFHLENFPKKLFILGAGYIALEFASIFNGLGSEVHVVLRKSKVLSGFDEDVQTFLQNEMEKNGIQFHY
ncbi:MAG: FAD-dependent oxidoreductase, partial [Bacteriovoracaceae bacterium]